MSNLAERLATLRADVRQRVQRVRATLERRAEGPWRRWPRRAPVDPWRAPWIDEPEPEPARSLRRRPEGLLSRPRNVRETSERLRNRGSLLKRQQTRRAL